MRLAGSDIHNKDQSLIKYNTVNLPPASWTRSFMEPDAEAIKGLNSKYALNEKSSSDLLERGTVKQITRKGTVLETGLITETRTWLQREEVKQ